MSTINPRTFGLEKDLRLSKTTGTFEYYSCQHRGGNYIPKKSKRRILFSIIKKKRIFFPVTSNEGILFPVREKRE